jgi:LCP family protein required for cell wall assembly
MSGKHACDNNKKKKEEPIEFVENEKKVKKEKVKTNKKKKGRWLKVLGTILLTIILILAILIGLAYMYITNKLSKMNTVQLDESQLGITAEASTKLAKYRNIAIFGVDSREDDYGKGNRSDCIIIASINNETKEVRLISVYRDTYVKIQGHGLDKITHAYSYGEAPLAINTLNTNLDLNISEFVTVNFDSVSDAVDELGGVTINIENEEIKYINDYIDATAQITHKTAKHITSAGRQTLDGVQAVAYSRIRYTAGGDYKRTERMRNVIEAMANKLKSKNIMEINNFMDEILPKVYTNISQKTVMSMIPDMVNYKVSTSIGWPYEVKGITLDRWYGVPVTLESNVVKLHQDLFDDPDYTLPESIKTTSDSIIKKTGYKTK